MRLTYAHAGSMAVAAAMLAAATMMPNTTQGAVLGQDNFNSYATGTIAGQTPPAANLFTGFGDAGNPPNNDLDTIANGDLGGGPGKRLSILANQGTTGALGGNLNATLNTSSSGPLAGYLDTNGNIGLDDTILYVSLSFQVTGTEQESNHNYGGVTFTGGDSSFYVGKRYNFGSFQLNAGTGASARNLATYDSNLHQVVLRIDFKSGNDTITAWLDPVAGVGEAGTGQVTPVTVNTQSSLSFNTLQFGSRQTGDAGLSNTADFDNVVFGTTFDSVAAVPEPSTALMLLLPAALGMRPRRLRS